MQRSAGSEMFGVFSLVTYSIKPEKKINLLHYTSLGKNGTLEIRKETNESKAKMKRRMKAGKKWRNTVVLVFSMLTPPGKSHFLRSTRNRPADVDVLLSSQLLFMLWYFFRCNS